MSRAGRRSTTLKTVGVGLLLCVTGALSVAGCSTDGEPAASGTAAGTTIAPTSTPTTTAAAPAAPTTSSNSASGVVAPASDIASVQAAEIVSFRVTHGSDVIIEAQSSGMAKYRTSATCEVPGQPCYAAPSLSAVARIDVGAPPQSPGTQTTFVTGHSNRYAPDDPSRGIFSRLQQVAVGDSIDVTTSKGSFEYDVSQVLRVPFDQLTKTDAVVHVRPNTLVAISCEIAPDHGSYLGNYVVIGTLRSSSPV